MSNPVYTNFATTTLASLVSPGDVALTVKTGDGALFPVTAGGNWFYCVLSLGVSREIVKVTNRTGDVFTVLRGQDGTTAQSWTSGAKIELRTVAASIVDERSTSTPNLTGPIAATAGVTAVTAQTGTGTTFAMQSSPNFLGTPTAPTAPVSVNSTQIATTAFVQGLQGWVNAASYGATPSLVTDQATAINNALSLSPAGSIVVLAPGIYRVSSTINIPAGKTLFGLGYGPNVTDAPVQLAADLALTPVVSMNGGGASAGVAIRSVGINRTAGAVPAGCIGLLVTATNNPIIEDVIVYRCDVGVKLATTLGTNLSRVQTTVISGTHLWIEDSQEIHAIACRFGKNGGLDVACNEYVRIKGNSDTMAFTQCQFNVSAANVSRIFYLDTYTSGNGILSTSQCHFEIPSGTGSFLAQSGAANFTNLTINNCTLNFAGTLFDSSMDNHISYLNIVGCAYILPAATFTGVTSQKVVASRFISATTTTISGGTGAHSACRYEAGITLSGAAGSAGMYLTDYDGALTNTMTGKVTVLGLGQLSFPATQNSSSDVHTLDDYVESADNLTATPALQTPGTSSWTPTENNYRYTKIGREVNIEFNVVGSFTKGTGSGILLLLFTGFPYSSANTTSNSAVGTCMWGDALTAAGYTQMIPVIAPNANNGGFTWCGAGVIPIDVTAAHMPVGAFTLRLRGRITITTAT